MDYAAPSVGYIKRIVRAGDCLVVIHKEVVSTLAAQTRFLGSIQDDYWRFTFFSLCLVTTNLISSLFPAELRCSY